MAEYELKYITVTVEDGIEYEDKEYFGYVGLTCILKRGDSDLFFTIFNNKLLSIIKEVFPKGNPRYEDGMYLAEFEDDDDKQNTLILINKLRTLECDFDTKLNGPVGVL